MNISIDIEGFIMIVIMSIQSERESDHVRRGDILNFYKRGVARSLDFKGSQAPAHFDDGHVDV